MSARSWLLVCVLHGMASMLVWWAQSDSQQWLAWSADDSWRRPWTWWTTAWVHSNTPHLITNQIALGLLVVLAWLVRPDGWSTLAWCLAWPLVQLVLPWWPQVARSVGLAGVLHAAVAVLAVHLALGRLPLYAGRRWGALLGLALVVKLLAERGWSHPVAWDSATERSVVQAAMLAGAVWGVLLGLVTAAGAAALERRSRAPG